MLHGHGGNRIELARRLGCSPGEIIDMSSNINPLGPPPGLIKYLKDNIDGIGKFPEVDSREITVQFADQCRIDPDRVLAGNGTTQFIYALPQALGRPTSSCVRAESTRPRQPGGLLGSSDGSVRRSRFRHS